MRAIPRALVRTAFATACAVFATSAFAQQPIVLRVASPAPPPSYVNVDMLGPWAKAVTEASGGTLRVEVVAGGTLGTTSTRRSPTRSPAASPSTSAARP